MELYPVFLLMAAVSIISPGPSVIMTLTNTMRYGILGAMGGILGSIAGVITVAIISATGVGVILVDSTSAMALLKYLAIAYLIYFACNLWQAPKLNIANPSLKKTTFTKLFIGGSSLQLVNPYIVIFFLIIMPQFIDLNIGFMDQFLLLTASYIGLQFVILCAYALITKSVRRFLLCGSGGLIVNRVGSFAFSIFATVLLFSEQQF